ncbi:UbiA family prenyltransferase [Streptomyces sp. NPDC050428]|uniref:UbiA family prenyltransferase n=1 Tax=Streptomyces sp. NPDC050428 TaxID=3155757 RepID=UPI003431B850
MSLRAWAELLRVSALFTVPGDALAGAASTGVRPNRGTALAVASSLCLYEAGMALNDWADRDEDAVERPHRPIPSGRITPNAALTAAGALTATGLLFASRAGRPTLALSTALAATVWAYDLRLKHTPAGPAAMGAARALDVLLGAAATHAASRRTPPRQGSPTGSVGTLVSRLTGSVGRPVVEAASTSPRRGVLARLSAWADGSTPRRGRGSRSGRTPTASVSRDRSTPGGAPASKLNGSAPRGASEAAVSTARFSSPPTGRDVLARMSAWANGPVEPLASRSAGPAGEQHAVPRSALAPAALLGAHTVAVTTVSRREVYGGSVGAPLGALVVTGVLGGVVGRPRTPGGAALVTGGLAAAYAVTAGRPFLHAALNPSPQLTQRAVGGGIRAMIPFQAALAARGGAPGIGLAVMGLVPLARKLARKVSVT